MDRPEGLMIAALVAATIALVSAAVIGGRGAEDTASASEVTEDTDDSPDTIDYDDLGKDPVAGPKKTSGPAATATGGPAATAGPAAKKIAPTQPRASTQGATRIGVFGGHFEISMHAPITINGVPLPLADDPVVGVKGYITHINRKGGINGLKIKLQPHDDRYTVDGGQIAADRIVKEDKPFIASGVLGIDQIAKVAKAAGAAGIPYFAGGGPEPEFKDVGMYQVLSSYDQYLDMVVAFICKYGAGYVGGSKATDIRLGTTTLDSENILPVEKRFVSKITAKKCVRTPVDSRARGTIAKPSEQSSYAAQRLDLQASYGGDGANLLIPLQDPISTSRQVLEWAKFGYRPKWTIADFAHEGDTSLTLFQGEWTGMRVMSGGCYYHPSGGGKPYDPKLCAAMGEAHKQFISIGQVTFDENAGGDWGRSPDYNFQEGDANSEGWVRDGSGASFGYQLVYFWNQAMKAIGTDPTREKFVAAMEAYDNYSNLVTSPITFKGSPNNMIGAKKFVLFEGKDNLKYRQVTEITPGLVDHF